MKVLLEQARTPGRGKLGVADGKNVQGDELVKSGQYSPLKIGKDIPVLVLPKRVITVQVHTFLPEPKVFKSVLKVGNDGI